MAPNYSKQVVKEPKNLENVETIFNGNNLEIRNTNLGLSKIYDNYKYLNENILWLNFHLENYKKTHNLEETEVKEDVIEETEEDIKEEMVFLEDDETEETVTESEEVKETEEVRVEEPAEEEKEEIIEEPVSNETEEIGSVSYVLSDGESLVNIAEKVYPSPDNWDAIYYFNKETIDKYLVSNGIDTKLLLS